MRRSTGIGLSLCALFAASRGRPRGPARPPPTLRPPRSRCGRSTARPRIPSWATAGSVAGASGQALQLDGISGHLRRPAARVPLLPASFTLEAFVALGAYPFNWAPILQQQDERSGFFLGLGDEGQVGFRVMAGGRSLEIESRARVPLRQWAHVVAVFAQGRGARLYLDGALAGEAPADGAFEPARGADLLVGRNAFELEQTAPVSPAGSCRRASSSTASSTRS